MRVSRHLMSNFFSMFAICQFLFLLPVSGEINSEAAPTPQHSTVKNLPQPIGPCTADCTCGCVQGGACTCNPPKHTKVKNPCGPNCKCGCAQGGPCHCSLAKQKKMQEQQVEK